MSKRRDFNSKFWVQVIRKGDQAVAYYFSGLVVIGIVLRGTVELNGFGWSGFALVALGATLRFFQSLRLKNDHEPNIKSLSIQCASANLMIAIGWSLIIVTTTILGRDNFSILHFTILFMTAMVAALAFRLAPVPWLARVTTALLLFPSAIGYAWVSDTKLFLFIAVLTVAYYIFLYQQVGTISALMKNAVLGEAISRKEVDMISGILDAVPGIVSVIDNNLVYRSINKMGREFLGFDPTDLKVGFTRTRPEFETAVRNFFESADRTYTGELPVFHHNEVHWYFVSMSKLAEPIGGVIIVSIPIDDLRNAQKDADAQRAKAEYSARLASLGQMAGGVAHEINNPLAIISAKAQLLLAVSEHHEFKAEDHARMKEYAKGIVETTTRITKIIRGLRTFAKDGSQDARADSKVATIVDETVAFCESRVRSLGIELKTTIDPNIHFRVQTVQLSQVLLNLLNNSIDACNDRRDAQIEILGRETESAIEIRVIDNGEGIPEKIRAKIMDPFFTTKEVGKGTGLGLSISQGIVAANGGRLYLDTKSKKTEFVMEFPKIKDPASAKVFRSYRVGT